jgi:hypothetical protein
LLKEKNLLLSERDAARARKEMLANPFRVTKVRKSMCRIKAVMWERARLESKDAQELKSLKAFIDALWFFFCSSNRRNGTGNKSKMTRPPPLLAFSDDCAGLAVSFAVFDFGRQLLVWAAPEGSDENLLGALALGAPPPPPPPPPPLSLSSAASPSSPSSSPSSSSSSSRRGATATTLLRSGPLGKEDEGSMALAKRLAARLRKPVAVAWNLPSLGSCSSSTSGSSSSATLSTSAGAAALNAWAERRLLAELDRAGLLPATMAATTKATDAEDGSWEM